MAVPHGKLEGLITTPAAWTATLTETSGGGGTLVTITAARFAYWSTVAPAGAGTFPALMKAALEAASANGRTYVVTVNAGENDNGKLSIGVVADTFTLDWISTDWRDLCGFVGNLGPAAATFTSDNHVKNLWIATGAQVTETGPGHSGKYESDQRGLATAAGHITKLHSFTKQVQAIQWEGETLVKTRAMTGADANVSCEQFWLDVIQGGVSWCYPGDRIRHHFDADDDATHETYKVDGQMDETFVAAQFFERNTVAWVITFDRLVVVP